MEGSQPIKGDELSCQMRVKENIQTKNKMAESMPACDVLWCTEYNNNIIMDFI